MASKEDYSIGHITVQSQGFDLISPEKNSSAYNKIGVTATTTTLDEDDSQEADESGTTKPDRNLKAAIWAIVCGVALPCIPVIIISAVLMLFVFLQRDHLSPGYPELALPTTNTKCEGFIQCLAFIRHNAGEAYYVYANPSTITTIASWTSRVIPYLTSSIMALVAFFAARRIVTKSNKGGGEDLPTPEQLTLLIDLLGGKGIEPLKDTMFHRWVHKKKLVDPIPLAFGALFAITMLGLIIPLVDTWFGIATTAVVIAQQYPIENMTDPSWFQPMFMSSRVLSNTSCPNGPGSFRGARGDVWASCNLNVDISDDDSEITFDLAGSDEAIRALTGAPTALTSVSNYTDPVNGSDKTEYYFLSNPNTARDPYEIDYKAATFAVTTQCFPITQKCLPGSEWPTAMVDSMGNNNFSCTPGFSGNFTFPGGAQTIDADEPDGENASGVSPVVGIAFAADAALSERIGALDGTGGGNQSIEYIRPANPLHFAAWASGYPSYGLPQGGHKWAVQNPLLNDSQIYRSDSGTTEWVLNCSTTVYEVTYTWVNGTVRHFNKTLASPEMGALISAPFAISNLRERYIALTGVAAAAGASDNAIDLANLFADRFSQAALALSAGVTKPQINIITQYRNNFVSYARVPKAPFFILLALKAIYVLAVLALAIGAYCFTHPAETEIVKTQLSTRGLAAAHFDTPDILQSKVVSQLSERLQPTVSKESDSAQEDDDPAKGGLRRAATFLGDIPDKRIGVVAQADGAWRFAVVANGVWTGIKPLAVDIAGIEARAGNLGDAGDLYKAWMK